MKAWRPRNRTEPAVIVRIKIDEQGKVKWLRIVDSPDDQLSMRVESAIWASEPFGVVPASVPCLTKILRLVFKVGPE